MEEKLSASLLVGSYSNSDFFPRRRDTGMADKQTEYAAGAGNGGLPGSSPMDAQPLEQPPPYTMMAPPYTMQPPPYTMPAPHQAGFDKAPQLSGPYLEQQQPTSVFAPPKTTRTVTSGLQSFNFNRPMGPDPVQRICYCCGQSIVTKIDYEVGDYAQSMMWLFCWFGGLVCCWVPLCVSSMKDVVHSCPNCKYQLGRYKR
ncbi:hypothetical protein BV898_15403 [Hypsibius exemplaris]|uniref:LITAF domain-containing protein n=1 Tax=Hypsibius exemplaris TaxID=2072580 RepID=A0A9X6RKD9_HYPEX|nr:hypothetical protein BV898_15403 [Hypsibius exemplaris]